jgi:hypothetical protein
VNNRDDEEIAIEKVCREGIFRGTNVEKKGGDAESFNPKTRR